MIFDHIMDNVGSGIMVASIKHKINPYSVDEQL